MISEQAKEAVRALDSIKWLSCNGWINPEALRIVQSVIDAERANNEWKRAVNDTLLTLFVTTGCFETPREAIEWLITESQKIALDPAVSADARSLVDAERERCARLVENFGPQEIKILRKEDYSGEHREWFEPITLPRRCTVYEPIAAAIRGATND